MAKKDLANYEKEVDKLFATYVDGINKELKHCSDVITKGSETLAKKINNIHIPEAMDEQEIKEIPNIIKEIAKNHNTKLDPEVVQLQVMVSADVDERTVWVGSVSIRGFVVKL